MNKITDNLFIGNENDCFYTDKTDWAVVHACKDPCHKRAVGYKGNLNKSHPYYLIFKNDNHLFLNMVDMNTKLLPEFTEPILSITLNFIDERIKSRNILIHCNQGISRSPALALIYLAKRAKSVSNGTYDIAKRDFEKHFQSFNPGQGIDLYLTEYWHKIV